MKRKERYKLTFYSGFMSPELCTQTEQNLIERGLEQHPNQIHQIGEVTLKRTVDDWVIEDMGSVTEDQVRPEWVQKLQEALGIQVDGRFGKDTEAVLKAWQQEHGLEPDGIAGRNTYRALGLIA